MKPAPEKKAGFLLFTGQHSFSYSDGRRSSKRSLLGLSVLFSARSGSISTMWTVSLLMGPPVKDLTGRGSDLRLAGEGQA